MNGIAKKTILMLLVIFMVFSCFTSGLTAVIKADAEETNYIDNSSLLPAYKPDSEVTVDENGHPDWMSDLIMTQFRIETVSEEGTFQTAVDTLDHLAETGINGVWINPIFERESGTSKSVGRENNGYHNLGPDTIEPTLTGTDDLEESYKIVKTFVDEAHKRNIRVIFDIVVWGTGKDSPLVESHPEFYVQPLSETWGGWAWDWNSKELKEYFKNAAVDFIMKTGADGFRVDIAPEVSGYYFKEVKDELLAQGKKVMIMSEHTSERKGAFDIEQFSVGWGIEPKWTGDDNQDAINKKKYGHHGESYVKEGHNIVDSVKTGNLIGHANLQKYGNGSMYKYYTFNYSHHDDSTLAVRGNRVKMGYQGIFAPFIPMWYLGDEWNNPKKPNGFGGVMFFNVINWARLDEPKNRAFYEDVKQFIKIRRSNADVFQYFPNSLRDTNIEKVSSEIVGAGENNLQAYARYVENKSFIILPNYTDQNNEFKVTPDYSIIGLNNAGKLKITDMITDKVLFEGTKAELASFNVSVEKNYLSVLKIDGIGESGEPLNPGGTSDAGKDKKGGIDKKVLIIATAAIVVVVLAVGVLVFLKSKTAKTKKED